MMNKASHDGTEQEYTQAEQLPHGDANDRSRSDQPAATTSQGRLKETVIDGQVFFAVEGDLLLDADEFDLYREQQAAEQTQRAAANFVQSAGFGMSSIRAALDPANDLVGILTGDKIVRWAPDTVLTYCVLKSTFPRDEWYEEVVENMRQATEAWEKTCGIDFEHRADLDESPSLRPAGVVFPVRYIDSNDAFIAAAFFPTDPPQRRRVLIDPSYFTTTFDHVGVLRHELGHVLGFRHEHIRSGAPPVCFDEDLTDIIELTKYDPQSVMHYFCGGVGSRTLEITNIDLSGARLVYGLPLARFNLIHP